MPRFDALKKSAGWPPSSDSSTLVADALQRGVDLAKSSKEVFVLANIYWHRGRWARQQGQFQQAERDLRKARQVAESQQAQGLMKRWTDFLGSQKSGLLLKN